MSYKKAVNFAEKNLGQDDGITQNLRSVYENAKNEVSTMSFINIFWCSWTWLYSKKAKREEKELRPKRREVTTNNNTWRETKWAYNSLPEMTFKTWEILKKIQKMTTQLMMTLNGKSKKDSRSSDNCK